MIKLDGLYLEQIVEGKLRLTPTQANAERVGIRDCQVMLGQARRRPREDGKHSDEIRLVRLIGRSKQHPGLSAALLALAMEAEKLPVKHPLRRAAGAVLNFF